MKATISRRNFLKASAISGGSLLIGLTVLGELVRAETIDATEFLPNGYIRINADGQIIVLAPNPEIGQGVKTSLAIIIAEELCVQWKDIKVELAPLDEKFGRQTAGGSGSIRGRYTALRTVGAAAREMLVSAAAQRWGVPVVECMAADGKVVHKPTARTLAYGDLAVIAAKMEVPSNPVLKDPKDFKLIGTRIGDADAFKIATGAPLFGIDTRKEGMLYAMVARAPAYGKTLGEVDDAATREASGVRQIVKLKNAVAVLATSTWAAKKGRDALKIIWNDTQKLEHTAEHFVLLKALVDKGADKPSAAEGDIEQVRKSASKYLDVTYKIPSLSHGQMEPLNFYADVRDGEAELYGPTQVPGQVRIEVAKLLGIPEAKIQVGVPRQGGGFGRKLMSDNAVEAALISAAAKCPVQVQWSREDDMQNDFFRPTEMFRYRASLSAENVLSWYQSAAGIAGIRGDSYITGILDNFRSEAQVLRTNIPTGWWRAPGANTLAFAAESFMDEICFELKKDPIAFRLDIFQKAILKPGARLGYDPQKYKGVVELVAKMSNWGSRKKGVFRGFATWFSFGSYAAQVFDLKLIDGMPRIMKVYCAVNCGRVINLSGAENQVEGAIVDGICHAMHPKITFVDGAVEEKNFHSYKLLRINEAPLEIEVKFVDTQDAPTGLGEPGLPPAAPALANAIFAATGKRIRQMPFIENM